MPLFPQSIQAHTSMLISDGTPRYTREITSWYIYIYTCIRETKAIVAAKLRLIWRNDTQQQRRSSKLASIHTHAFFGAERIIRRKTLRKKSRFFNDTRSLCPRFISAIYIYIYKTPPYIRASLADKEHDDDDETRGGRSVDAAGITHCIRAAHIYCLSD